MAIQRDTLWIIKALVIALVLGLLAAFLVWLTESGAGATQFDPTTRMLDLRLVGRSHLTYEWPDAGLIQPSGEWSETKLPMPRVRSGRIRVLQVTSGWGDNLLVAILEGPPTRGNDEGWDVAVVDLPGSQWVPPSGRGQLWQLDGGSYRLMVRVALASQGVQNGRQNLQWADELRKMVVKLSLIGTEGQ